jgi:hypothetical protein
LNLFADWRFDADWSSTTGARRIAARIEAKALADGPWSICELRFEDAEYAALASWFKSLTVAEIRKHMGRDALAESANGTFVQGRCLTKNACFGLLFYCTIVEHLHRKSGSDVWKSFDVRPADDHATRLLFNPNGYPTRALMDCLRDTARELKLRNVMGDDDRQRWYDTITLQRALPSKTSIGPLATALVGGPQSVMMKFLREDLHQSSDSYRTVWDLLSRFAQRHHDHARTELELATSCWAPREPLTPWLNELMRCVVTATAARADARGVTDQATAKSSGESPLGAEPKHAMLDGDTFSADSDEFIPIVFCSSKALSLCWRLPVTHPSLPQDEPLELLLNGRVYQQLGHETTSDGLQLKLNNGERHVVLSLQPENVIEIVDFDGTVLITQVVRSVEEEHEFRSFDENGQPCDGAPSASVRFFAIPPRAVLSEIPERREDGRELSLVQLAPLWGGTLSIDGTVVFQRGQRTARQIPRSTRTEHDPTRARLAIQRQGEWVVIDPDRDDVDATELECALVKIVGATQFLEDATVFAGSWPVGTPTPRRVRIAAPGYGEDLVIQWRDKTESRLARAVVRRGKIEKVEPLLPSGMKLTFKHKTRLDKCRLIVLARDGNVHEYQPTPCSENSDGRVLDYALSEHSFEDARAVLLATTNEIVGVWAAESGFEGLEDVANIRDFLLAICAFKLPVMVPQARAAITAVLSNSQTALLQAIELWFNTENENAAESFCSVEVSRDRRWASVVAALIQPTAIERMLTGEQLRTGLGRTQYEDRWINLSVEAVKKLANLTPLHALAACHAIEPADKYVRQRSGFRVLRLPFHGSLAERTRLSKKPVRQILVDARLCVATDELERLSRISEFNQYSRDDLRVLREEPALNALLILALLDEAHEHLAALACANNQRTKRQ